MKSTGQIFRLWNFPSETTTDDILNMLSSFLSPSEVDIIWIDRTSVFVSILNLEKQNVYDNIRGNIPPLWQIETLEKYHLLQLVSETSEPSNNVLTIKPLTLGNNNTFFSVTQWLLESVAQKVTHFTETFVSNKRPRTKV
jgi:hypothetical protein